MWVKSPGSVNVSPGGTQSHVMIAQNRKASEVRARLNVPLNLDSQPTSSSRPLQRTWTCLHCADGLYTREFPKVKRLSACRREHSIRDHQERGMSKRGGIVTEIHDRVRVVRVGLSVPRGVAKPNWRSRTVGKHVDGFFESLTRCVPIGHELLPSLVVPNPRHMQGDVMVPPYFRKRQPISLVANSVKIDKEGSNQPAALEASCSRPNTELSLHVEATRSKPPADSPDAASRPWVIIPRTCFRIDGGDQRRNIAWPQSLPRNEGSCPRDGTDEQRDPVCVLRRRCGFPIIPPSPPQGLDCIKTIPNRFAS